METTGYKFNRTDDSSARLCEKLNFSKMHLCKIKGLLRQKCPNSGLSHSLALG
jgi:hypothetical protein